MSIRISCMDHSAEYIKQLRSYESADELDSLGALSGSRVIDFKFERTKDEINNHDDVKDTFPKRTCQQSFSVYQHEISLLLPNKIKEIASAQKQVENKLKRILDDKKCGNIYNDVVSYFGDCIKKYEGFLKTLKIEKINLHGDVENTRETTPSMDEILRYNELILKSDGLKICLLINSTYSEPLYSDESAHESDYTGLLLRNGSIGAAFERTTDILAINRPLKDLMWYSTVFYGEKKPEDNSIDPDNIIFKEESLDLLPEFKYSKSEWITLHLMLIEYYLDGRSFSHFPDRRTGAKTKE